MNPYGAAVIADLHFLVLVYGSCLPTLCAALAGFAVMVV
jgi:hypothetical protein